MPQNPYRQVNGPDGPINFPASMSDGEVEQAMQRLYPPHSKQYLPEVDQAIRTVPRPQPPEAPMRDQVLDALTSMRATPFASSALFDPRGGVPRGPDPTTQWLDFPRDITQGAEQMAEPQAEEKKFGAARIMGGTAKAMTPLMVAAGVEAPVAAATGLIGAEVGSRGAEYTTRQLGGSPGSQALAGQVGAFVGGAAAGGGEFYRERYWNMVERAKADMRAQRGFGSRVDEGLLQREAERAVQINMARGNSFPELSQEAINALIRAAQAGAFTPRDKTLPEKFGKDAMARPSEEQRSPTQPGIVEQPSPTTRPLTPVERTEQMIQQARVEEQQAKPKVKSYMDVLTDRAKEKAKHFGEYPDPNEVAKQRVAADRAELLAKFGMPESPTPRNPSPMERVERAKDFSEEIPGRASASPAEDEIAMLGGVRRMSEKELTPGQAKALKSLEAMRTSRDIDAQAEARNLVAQNADMRKELAKQPPPPPPTPTTPLEAKQAEMRERNAPANQSLEEAKAFIEARRRMRQTEIDRLTEENNALRAQAASSPAVGRVGAPPESAKPPAEPRPPAETTTRSREPLRTSKGPSLGLGTSTQQSFTADEAQTMNRRIATHIAKTDAARAEIKAKPASEILNLGDVRQGLVRALIQDHKVAKADAETTATHLLSSTEAAGRILANPQASSRVKLLIQLGQKLAEAAVQPEAPKLEQVLSTEPRSSRGVVEVRPDFAQMHQASVKELAEAYLDLEKDNSAEASGQRTFLFNELRKRPGLGSTEAVFQLLADHADLRGEDRPAVLTGTRLGAREPKPASGQLDFKQRLELQRQLVEQMQADPKYKGVAKARLQEIAAEKIKNERGALGGYGPEDIRARREAKIQGWVDMLKSDKTHPRMLDYAFKMLKTYGLTDNEIISRVKGEVPPEPTEANRPSTLSWIESALNKTDELRPSFPDEFIEADSVTDAIELGDKHYGKNNYTARQEPGQDGWIVRPINYTSEQRLQQAARLEGYRQNGPITGVKGGSAEEINAAHPATQELERMFNLKDERGFWKMLPAKKIKPTGPGTGTALDDLTRSIESTLKAIPPNDSRMKIAERLDKEVTEGWDEVQKSLGRLSAQAAVLKDSYLRPPVENDFKSSLGRFVGSLNRSAWELRKFTNAIKKNLPDIRQREAVTNWLQAGGDDNILAQRSARSTGYVRASYERARHLTQDEIGYAKMIEAHFDRRFKEAVQQDLVHSFLENYVPQIWKKRDQPAAMNFFSSITRSGLLKPDFNAGKHRIFDSYFEGEQAGFKPVNKDIGFLVASYERAFNQAVASKNLVFDLSKALAKDGRPILAPSGSGKRLFDSGSQSPLATEPPSAYLIYPKGSPEDSWDYRAVNHPALTKWTWTASDDNGAPIFLKGDLRVHPEFAQKLDNIINRGKWAAEHPVQVNILKAQGFFKATLLSASPFHQIQEGTHAIFHKVNPFHPPDIDLTNPTMNKLLDHGLVIGNYDPVAAFDEGLVSGSGGALGKIPGLGTMMQKYSDYLFGSYIPRLKSKMAMEAFERNMNNSRFKNLIAQGRLTENEVAELTANEANAAFGELNYIMMGRHPQTQAIMRMMFLAPDFLEARTRFVAQAFTPAGREQQAALIRGALGLYVGFRVLNKIFDDDYHWNKPFSLIAGGYEYKMRSLPGDVWNMLHEPNSFAQHRLSFIPRAGAELITGKDDFGRKRNLGEQIMDFVNSVVPIPFQGLQKKGEQNLLGEIAPMFGVSQSKYRTEAGALAHQYALNALPSDITSHHVTEMVREIEKGQLDGDKVGKLLVEGKMNPHDLQTAMKLAQMPELYRDYYRLPVELKAKVFLAATPQEKALLMSYARKAPDTTRLLPAEREQYLRDLADQ